MAWPLDIPENLTYDGDGGVKVPMRDHPFVKESPDLGHFVNRAFAQHKELGSRLSLKKAETPEAAAAWRTEHLPKLYDAGLLTRPPTKPEEYEIKKPEEMPKGMIWSDERAGKFGAIGVKHGIPKAAMSELLELHREAFSASVAEFNTTYEEGQLALKREFGDKFDEVMEDAKRFTPLIFKDAKDAAFLAETGIGNHPQFLGIVARLAQFAKSDASFADQLKAGGGGSGATGDEVRSELSRIMNDTTHPKYALFKKQDPKTMQEIDEMYKKAYPGQLTVS